jgi:hypothetical protein
VAQSFLVTMKVSLPAMDGCTMLQLLLECEVSDGMNTEVDGTAGMESPGVVVLSFVGFL